jgi:hypothetical protein
MQYACLKRLSTPSRLHGAISQKTHLHTQRRENLKSHKVESYPATAFHAPNGRGVTRSYSFITLALDGVSGQCHDPAALYPQERTAGTHLTGGWVNLRVGLETEAI